MTASSLALAAIVLAAFTTQAATGFGAMLIAVTLGAFVLPIREVVPLLVPLNLLLNGYLALRYRRQVAGRLLLGRVLPLMGAGLAVGQLVFHAVAAPALTVTLGILVVLLAGRELWLLVGPGRLAAVRPLSPARGALWLLGGGVVHGVFATGGPFAVYVLGRGGLDKGAFRSTLAVIWLVLNGLLTISFAATQRIDEASLLHVAGLVPVLVLATLLGERIFRNVEERTFRVVVFSLLLAAGLLLARQSVRSL